MLRVADVIVIYGTANRIWSILTSMRLAHSAYQTMSMDSAAIQTISHVDRIGLLSLNLLSIDSIDNVNMIASCSCGKFFYSNFCGILSFLSCTFNAFCDCRQLKSVLFYSNQLKYWKSRQKLEEKYAKHGHWSHSEAGIKLFRRSLLRFGLPNKFVCSAHQMPLFWMKLGFM